MRVFGLFRALFEASLRGWRIMREGIVGRGLYWCLEYQTTAYNHKYPQYSAVQCCALMCSAVQLHSVQCSAVLPYAPITLLLMYSALPRNLTLTAPYTVLYCTATKYSG